MHSQGISGLQLRHLLKQVCDKLVLIIHRLGFMDKVYFTDPADIAVKNAGAGG
jgi:hypothetical protein